MTDEQYEVLASRLESFRGRTARQVSEVRQDVNTLFFQVQNLQADIRPLLDDLLERVNAKEQVAALHKKRQAIAREQYELSRYEWDANLAILRERLAELDAQIANRVNVGGFLTRLSALLMLLALPVAFILSAMGVITSQQQTNAFAGAALLSIGGGALALWSVFTEADQ